MTETYRTTELERAKGELAKAHAAVSTAKSRSAKMRAYEDVEFWGNKVAFLTFARG